MKRLFVYLAVVMSAFLGITASASAKCGDVTMAEMNWASAELMANIDKVILEKGSKGIKNPSGEYPPIGTVSEGNVDLSKALAGETDAERKKRKNKMTKAKIAKSR